MTRTARVAAPAPVVAGDIAVRRARPLGWPIYEMAADGVSASLGRYSVLNIYFGRGQRVVLSSGARWRLTAIEKGAYLCPVVLNEAGERLAMATAWIGNYGINGRDYAYMLNPAEAGWGRAGRWDLYEGEDLVAGFSRRPFAAHCYRPLALPAVLLGLLLARGRIPGEGDRGVPELRWT